MDNNITLNRGLIATLSKEIFADISDLKNMLPKSADRLEPGIPQKLFTLSRISETARLRSLSKIFDVLARASETFTNAAPDAGKWDVFLRCFRSLMNHLQEIVYEHKNTPIIMARPLYNLMQSTGLDVSPALAGELFMPYIPYDMNAKSRPTQLSDDDFATSVKEHKASYHAEFEKLVKNNDLTSFGSMRQTMVTLEPKNPHPGFRIFFDASIAFFDRLIKTQQFDNLSKWLVGRMDNELARIISGEKFPSDNILSAMLYVAAQADPAVGVRIRKIQDHYGLAQYMADPNGVDPAVIEKFLNVLIKAREMWTSAVSSNSMSDFKKLIGEMTQKSGFLKNSGFSLIADTVNQLTDFEIANPGKIDKQVLSLDGASALLIMEQQVREGSNMDIARSASNKLLAMMGKELHVQEQTSDGVVGGRQHNAALYRLAEEILTDLGGIEQNMLDFLSGNLDVQEEMLVALKRVGVILSVLSDPTPGKLVDEFSKIVKIPESKEEREVLANGFAHLTSMVELLKNSEASSIDAAKKGLALFSSAVEKVEIDLPAHPAEQMAKAENVDTPNDAELLEIFLEETTDILASLKTNLATLSKHPEDKTVLTDIRRSYHTLKGSGRMVGLKHFGEASWQVEDVLNRWIKTNKPVSEQVIDFVKSATVSVTGWLDNLRSPAASTAVDYSEIEKAASEINSGSVKKPAPVNVDNILGDLSVFEQSKETVSTPTPVVKEEPVILVTPPPPPPAPAPHPVVEMIKEPVAPPAPAIELAPPEIEEKAVTPPVIEFAEPVKEVAPPPPPPPVAKPVIELAPPSLPEEKHPAKELAKPVQASAPPLEFKLEEFKPVDPIPPAKPEAVEAPAHPVTEMAMPKAKPIAPAPKKTSEGWQNTPEVKDISIDVPSVFPSISIKEEKAPTPIIEEKSTFYIPTTIESATPIVSHPAEEMVVHEPHPVADEPIIPEKWKNSANPPEVRKSHFENFMAALKQMWKDFKSGLSRITGRKK